MRNVFLATNYPMNSVRLTNFLAASEYFSQKKFDDDNALKLRPYGGLIGIDKSSVRTYLFRFVPKQTKNSTNLLFRFVPRQTKNSTIICHFA